MLAIYPVKNEIIDLILDNYSKQFQSMFVFHTALEYRSSFAKAADLKKAVDLLIGLIAWTNDFHSCMHLMRCLQRPDTDEKLQSSGDALIEVPAWGEGWEARISIKESFSRKLKQKSLKMQSICLYIMDHNNVQLLHVNIFLFL